MGYPPRARPGRIWFGLCVAAIVADVTIAHAAGDPAAGEKVFVRCKLCHQVGSEAKNAVGPVLNDVVGRKAGTYPGYSYSDAMMKSGMTWTPAEMDKFLKHPREAMSGTKMIFPGLPKNADRQNVIAYLEKFGKDGSK